MRIPKTLSNVCLAVLVAGALALAAAPASAADWKPSKPITILVGFSVGGAMDTAARLQGGSANSARHAVLATASTLRAISSSLCPAGPSLGPSLSRERFGVAVGV